MGVLIISLMLLFLRCQVCRGEMVTAQLGDFIELYSGLKNCDNANKSKIIGDFSRCTSAVVNTATLTKFSDTWTQLCGNKQAYLDCWNPVVEKSKACNFRTNDGFPVVYKASLNGLCGTDNGNANAAKFVKAMNEVSTEQCSANGAHWMEACAGFQNEMNSKDACTRYRGLSKCVSEITCKEQPVGRAFLAMYKDAGKYLPGC